MPVPEKVISDTDFPDKSEIVVIGAGIAGVTTALELAERGLQVVVLEKGVVAGEQSSKNWGWCRQMGRDPEELPLIQVSMDLWRGMNRRVGAETGYREDGGVFLCQNEQEMLNREAWFNTYAKAHGLSSKLISSDAANAMTPGATVQWKGGLFTPDDGRAEPELAVSAMAKRAQQLGVKIFQNCAVRSLERQGGKLSGVITELGEISCANVVVCGGAWSRRFCHNAGIELPQLSVVNSVMRTAPFESEIKLNLLGPKFAIRKRLDGGYTIAHADYSIADILPDSFRLFKLFWPLLREGKKDYKLRIGERTWQELGLKRRWANDQQSPFEKVRLLEPKPVNFVQKDALQALHKILPEFGKAQIAEEWAGVIDVTPDVVPVISAVEGNDGLYLSTGYSGHGFGLGPGAGKLMAQIIVGEDPCVDPSPFAFSRFS